ncbi:MAG: hypothetical protein RL235_495, partial [Chlamydiota bacterium]
MFVRIVIFHDGMEIKTLAYVSCLFTTLLHGTPYGVIGGYDQGTVTPYFGLVSDTGVVTAPSGAGLPTPGSGQIFSVAINDLGNGIVGGLQGGTLPYAALVSSTGVTTPLSGFPLPLVDAILTVSINHSGNAIIGGGDVAGSAIPYV